MFVCLFVFEEKEPTKECGLPFDMALLRRVLWRVRRAVRDDGQCRCNLGR